MTIVIPVAINNSLMFASSNVSPCLIIFSLGNVTCLPPLLTRAGTVWAGIPRTQDLLSKWVADAAGACPSPSPLPLWSLLAALPPASKHLSQTNKQKFVFWPPGPSLLPPAAGPNWRGMEPPGAALNLHRWELEYGRNDGNWSMDTHRLFCKGHLNGFNIQRKTRNFFVCFCFKTI